MEWLIGGITFFIAGLVLVIPFAILCLVKLVLIGIFCWSERKGEKWRSLEGADALFAMNKTGEEVVLSNVGFLIRLEGNVEVSQLRGRFYECFLAKDNGERYEKLWSWIDTRGGHCFRVSSRSRLNLEEHIRERSLEDCQVEDFVGTWLLKKYKPKKPCWEMALLKGPKLVAVAMKINHVMCDGYSLLHLINKLTGNTSPYLVKSEEIGMWEEIKLLLKAPLYWENPFSPDRVFNPVADYSRAHWSISFVTLSLPLLKDIRRKFNCHMVSLIMSLMAGAVSRYLTESKTRVPEEVTFATTLPWPGHPAMETSDPVLCNHFAASFFRVPVKSMDPAERLRRTEANYKSSIANGQNRWVPCIMNKVAWALPGALLGKAAGPGQVSGTSIPAGLTTIPAGEGYSLYGVPVSSIHSFTFGPHIVAHMSGYTISHDNKMQITLGASPRSVIESKAALHRIGHLYMIQELQALEKSN